MSGLPAQSIPRQKRSGNTAAFLARKVNRAGNEAAKLITFIFYLWNAADAELAAEQKWRHVFRLTSRSRISYFKITWAYFLWRLLFHIIKCGR